MIPKNIPACLFTLILQFIINLFSLLLFSLLPCLWYHYLLHLFQLSFRLLFRFFLLGSTGSGTFLASILPIKRCNGRICVFTSLDVKAGVSVVSTFSCFLFLVQPFAN